MVFGAGISDNSKTVPNQLEAKMKGADIINAGVKGYSPDQEYRFIIDHSQKFKPDIIGGQHEWGIMMLQEFRKIIITKFYFIKIDMYLAKKRYREIDNQLDFTFISADLKSKAQKLILDNLFKINRREVHLSDHFGLFTEFSLIDPNLEFLKRENF